MRLAPYSPFREIETMQRQINRLFDNLVGFTEDGYNTSFIPAAEIEETEQALHLKLEVPGLEPKDLNVEVTADAVSISGERKSETRTEEQGMVRSEFRYGKFQRLIPLPTRIQNNNVQAEYKDGILHLTLPKTEEEKNKVVKVTIQ
ncbi:MULTISPECIES: Hsp20/alpha crystallin family protein [Planktothricoides]|uniref:Hsp20/alpha crystallin family protein n=2 Tax=Planktothricoides raciborskii TaxID=132608 RepID=A0AAU8J812_9CYAN|nr:MULTISPECIES: Hsp20/alpha crystallin family protein [Planktothricoides]KOR38292.1 molecular chaperone [Planktothricoides sp. SR001]MBD2543352.1 Hsp20/alpha crystallin family protein [Planktothricoides raciborskii FACHB-1370]MBD2581651.1 Hsp20/alpha crystallin family protein [Planktothricoides raciborskii FACHB-1261]